MRLHLTIWIVGILIINSSCGDEIEKININRDWKFLIMEKHQIEEDDYHLLSYDDSNWETISLPHTPQLEPLIVNNQWQGTCWYRKKLSIPKNCSKKKVFIEFEAAMNYTKIWINGILLANHHGGYLPIVLDITDYIYPGRDNIIALRLNNTDNAITGPKPLHKLDFNMYGGLYRNAWMYIKDNIYISHPILAKKKAGGGIFITCPKVAEDESEISVKTHLLNESNTACTLVAEHTVMYKNEMVTKFITDENIIAANSGIELKNNIIVPDANLWSPSSPHLYQLITKVYSNNKLTDKEVHTFGIREFTFVNNELFINGIKTHLRGVNRHQEYPFIGYALSDNAQFRDAEKIKNAGFDYVRLSHYPQSPAFLDACDKLGLVVVNPILGWQYYLDNKNFREYCYRSARNLIRRDRNHPCVLAWEVSLNETPMPEFFIEKLHNTVSSEYPNPKAYSCGWVPNIYDIFLQARQHRILHPNKIPDKPYIVSEYGDWEYYSSNDGLNQHKFSKEERYEKSSRQKRAYGEVRLLQQAENIQEAHNDNFNTPAFADGYWVMFDYNRGYHDDIEYSGIMDIFRIPKFGYFFFKSQRNPDDEVNLKIASYWLPNSSQNVKVYSNCERIELFLNNKLIDSKRHDTTNNSTNIKFPPFTFHLPYYQDGTLKAIGYINNIKVAEDIVSTPKEPQGLKLWIDDSSAPPEAGKNDVIFLYIAVVDENGNTVSDINDKKIELNLNNNLELMNVGDIITEAGIATALLRIGNKRGQATIKAHSEGLHSASVNIYVK